MRDAETILGIIQTATTRFIDLKVARNRSLASRLRSKDSRAVLRGAVGKAFLFGSSSLAAYPTARPDLWEPWRVTAKATRPERCKPMGLLQAVK